MNRTLGNRHSSEFHISKIEEDNIQTYIERIKHRLLSMNRSMNAVIQDHIVIGELNDTEYEIISLVDLMKVLREMCKEEFSEREYNRIKEQFKQLGDEEYVFVENLLELFGETLTPRKSLPSNSIHESQILRSNYEASEIEKSEEKESETSHNDAYNKEEIVKLIKKLDNTSMQILKQLANYIEVNKVNLYDLLKEKIYTEQNTINVIKSQGFFAILRKIGVLPYNQHTKDSDIHKDLEDFLSINKQNYPFILFVKDLEYILKAITEIEETSKQRITESDLQLSNGFLKLNKSLHMKDNEEIPKPSENSTTTTLGNLPPILKSKAAMSEDLLEKIKDIAIHKYKPEESIKSTTHE